MIKIITSDGPGSRKLTVEGTLSDESLETVQACCVQALSNGKRVHLRLRDVLAISKRGRTVLRYLAAAGVDLAANGMYSSYIVDEFQSAVRNERRSCCSAADRTRAS